MQTFLTFVLPVLLGISVIIIVFIIKYLFLNTFLPRCQEWIGTSHSIAGEWESHFDAPHDQSLTCRELISVCQRSNKIWGDIYYQEIRTSDSVVICDGRFKFEGVYQNNVFVAIFLSTDRRYKGMGTFCLVSKRSTQLDGKYSLLAPDANQVVSNNYAWLRKQ